ncbi:MAG: pyruvate formate lyase-activating protein [Cyanothece sp. SIO2G6]|nr:pyruvate formate lyase-activating protein [Cyanothece sp. SIO2G6]
MVPPFSSENQPDSASAITGRIHSYETCGTVDGPGLRFVVFTQGCPLRCQYCHNPDSCDFDGGEVVTVDEIMTEILKYRSYLSRGGVTVSGGEPTLQPEFVTELLRRCQAEGLHTVLDTSGYVKPAVVRPLLAHVDLVLLDIKSFDPETYRTVTRVPLAPTLALARYLSDIQKPTWIRFVLVPDLTDAPANIEGLADFIASLTNVEQVEVLPFHQMGAHKWEQLGYDYKLKDTLPPSSQLLQDTINRFRQRGLTVVDDSPTLD